MKRILINGTHKEEKRAAFLVDNKLYDIDIEPINKVQFKSNIYLGKVSRIEPSLDAAFVNYGSERHGFLPFKEIYRNFSNDPKASKNTISDVLREGQSVLVQVEKEERGTKGAALTSFVALAGRYLVFLPNNPSTGGISRRLSNEDRDSMREILQQLEFPEGSGGIIRTAGVGQQAEDIKNDLDYLKQLWNAIDVAAKSSSAPKLIYQDNSFINRIIRDYVQSDVESIIADTQPLYEECRSMIGQIMPEIVDKVIHYEDESIPLFSKHKVEEQIETAYQHEVQLPSGGSIVIDHTEALVSIDINSYKSNKGGDIEETALHTNIEACQEIARQLRLRDIGGLIVIDFIDMTPNKNVRQVEASLKDALRYDRARVQVSKISRFGLLEMSRQRLRASLSENSTTTCSKCQGQGVVRTIDSLALSIFRLMQEQSCRDQTAQVRARLPLPVATYLLNEKRDEFNTLEISFSISIIILPVPDMQPPNYEITWVQEDGKTQTFVSQEDLDGANMDTENKLRNKALAKMKPLVEGEVPARPLQAKFFSKFLASLGFKKSSPTPDEPAVVANENSHRNNKSQGQRNNTQGRQHNKQRSNNNRNRHYARRQRQTQTQTQTQTQKNT